MNNQTTESDFGTKPIGSLLIKYSIPCVLSLLINSLYNIVDQIFIGRGVGYLGNGATNIIFPLTIIAASFGMMFGDGAAAWLSLKLGEGKKEQAAKGVGNALIMSVAVAIIFLAICVIFLKPLLYLFGCTDIIYPYAMDYGKIIIVGLPFMLLSTVMGSIIRADGSPRYAMSTVLVGCLLNIVLDYLFVFPMNMGIAGAARATDIGLFASAVMGLLYIPRFKNIRLTGTTMRFSPKTCGRICVLGVSSFINQATTVIVSALVNNLMRKYGAMSVYGAEIPITAMGIVMKVNSILIAFLIGIASGSQPIVGYNYGAKEYARVKQTYKIAAISAMIVAAIGLIIFETQPMLLISIFGAENDLYNEFACKCFRIFLMCCIGTAFHTVTCIFLQSIGRSIRSAILSLARQIILFIPLSLILPIFLGLDGVLWAAAVGDGLAFIFAVIFCVVEIRKINRESMAKTV
ncbi:MAG: MATE family efflux transporter [Lachnospiraceae bacterium]|nr:MATE family efflux transporter [Lachnospiraceae bacterium]